MNMYALGALWLVVVVVSLFVWWLHRPRAAPRALPWRPLSEAEIRERFNQLVMAEIVDLAEARRKRIAQAAELAGMALKQARQFQVGRCRECGRTESAPSREAPVWTDDTRTLCTRCVERAR